MTPAQRKSKFNFFDMYLIANEFLAPMSKIERKPREELTPSGSGDAAVPED